MHVQPVPIWIKDRKLISRFKSYLQYDCQSASDIPKKKKKKKWYTEMNIYKV